LLEHPRRIRLAGDREGVDPAAADGDEREHVEAAQPDGVARRAARFDQIHDDEDVVLVDGDLDLDWSDAGPPCAMAFAASS
jgi:hypothetical protein